MRKLFSIARKVIRWSAALFALAFIYICYIYLTLPDVRRLATTNPTTTAFIELRKREAREAGRTLPIRQRWVPYTQIANNLRRAVLVAEDSAFFDHEGVDLKELRATLESNWEEGRFTRGASTITQQLAKNLYLSPSRNPIRKLKELLITRRLEAALTKRRILELYLNVIEWGDGVFGAEAASLTYFGKPASALGPEEASLLAGAIINPREHSPARPTRRLLRRQQIIVRRMGIKPAPPPAAVPVPEAELPLNGQPSLPTPAAQTPQSGDSPIGFSPINQSPPLPPRPAQSVQPVPGNGGPAPVTPTIPKGWLNQFAAAGARLPPQRDSRTDEVQVQNTAVWLEQPVRAGINYTGHLTRLMQDIVARVDELSFIDLSRVLVFARPGRSSADGAYASCHCLSLPTSEPGYFFWRDRQSGEITRRTEWFVTKSPELYVGDQLMNYMISFALPRFTDQTLARSRKRALYPRGTPDWVAKLDTVVHELYHIDPEQNCLRRFKRPDGGESDALHSPTYFEDVAALVQQYLASNPDQRLVDFLKYDFAGLQARYGAVAGVTFRAFPSYPRRFREVVEDQPMMAEVMAASVERIVDPSTRVFSADDLQMREFRGSGSRLIANYTEAVAA